MAGWDIDPSGEGCGLGTFYCALRLYGEEQFVGWMRKNVLHLHAASGDSQSTITPAVKVGGVRVSKMSQPF